MYREPPPHATPVRWADGDLRARWVPRSTRRSGARGGPGGSWGWAVRITSGPSRIVASGCASTFGGHPLALTLAPGDLGVGGDGLVVELAFASDPGVPDVAVETETTDAGWRVRCTNFDDARGRGSAEPVLLGELGPDLLFLHFNVFRYGRGMDRTVQFTFFRVGKAEVGWVQTAG